MTKKEDQNSNLSFEAPLFQGIDARTLHPVVTLSDEQTEKYSFETLNFGDSARPKSCLEVDFPILKVNEIAAIENNATKPIYMMSKWWARRRSSVFRQLLISAATKAPKEEANAAQTSWSLMYRKKHQAHGKFSGLHVVDVFMGGGTTVVEAARLGYKVTGIDINPIAWWVVKNETDAVDPLTVQKLAKDVEEIVRPQIAPFYIAESPRGFPGRWIERTTGTPVDVDPILIPASQRHQYRWVGPEIVYTFWVKHIMCADPSCFHLTPLVLSSSVASKKVKLKVIENCVCTACGNVFELELGDFRMAPNAKFVLGNGVQPYVSFQEGNKNIVCPHCDAKLGLEWLVQQEKKKGKTKSKEVEHTLIVDKEWLKGISASTKEQYGGFHGATKEQDSAWFNERSIGLKLLEVRGEISQDLLHSTFGSKTSGGTALDSKDSNGKVICGGCGRQQEPLESIKTTTHQAPIFPFMIQGVDPEAKKRKYPYNGRFFDTPRVDRVLRAFSELSERTDLHQYIPQEELWFGHQTHQRTNLPAHGYSHWKTMFNHRQLYSNALLLKTISENTEASPGAKSQLLGAWQNYLRHNCMFTIWDRGYDKIAPHFSNNDYHPKATPVENCVFGDLGRGNFTSCAENVVEGLKFAQAPYDLKKNEEPDGAKSLKIPSDDKVNPQNVRLLCQSATDLRLQISENSIDLVITDPPFGDNLNYSELADFFIVWLHKPLATLFPEIFTSAQSPKALEAVANKARHPGVDADGRKQADVMYDRLLTLCWKECHRILKSDGLLAFTFHHDKDEAWIGVLESLFSAGFEIEGAFPIRSDATKGDGDFGAKKIEFDIVHVCRKRTKSPERIFWATLRKRIIESVKSKSILLAQHRSSGLHLADLEVIIRGEVLEQYSKHYGQVAKNLEGAGISVREILLEANLIAQQMLQTSTEDRLPDGLDPETRVYFSLFRDAPEIEFGAARKRLKGSGASLEDLEKLGWLTVSRRQSDKIVKITPAAERWNSLSRRTTLREDLDQVHFAINCCLGGRQLEGQPADWEAWIAKNYKSLIPSVGSILKFIENNHFGSDYKQAIGIAHRTLERTLQRIKENDGEFRKASEQMNLF